ncbi:biotin synthase [Ideonella dechloratans]|uniref:biotin synthase n=2 Tax=Ideonella dechloratans TaxID=36863 RepID=UPI001F1CC4E3|nr:biotin synthase [Ideonella dechloratans]UFU09355.1 biotin synthase [Ideonella dechloratans]
MSAPESASSSAIPSLADIPAPSVRLDPVALARIRRRLRSAPAPSWLHQEVARRMAERLSLIRLTPRQVLDWSLDAGPPAEGLRSAYPQATLQQVLPAGEAVSPAPWWKRWLGTGAAVPVAAEAVAPAGAGLVWSNMALQFENDPPALFAAWRRALGAEGFVMFSTLGPGSLPELRAVYAAEGWGEPHVPFVDMHDLGDMLVQAGFADPVMDQETLTLTYGSAEQLLAELRGWGGNAAPGRSPVLRGRAWRARLLQALQSRADAQGRIRLTLELVYGHAFQAPERGPAVAAETAVDLSTMRRMLKEPKSPR